MDFDKDVLFADKPAGLTTHTSAGTGEPPLSPSPVGLVESLSQHFDCELHVAHRLDRGTTGAIVFARTPAAAEILRAAFAEHRIQKRYLFITDRSSPQTEFETESFIERRGSVFVSLRDVAANSRTRFRRLKTEGSWSLWEAFPASGKPHQIRLHAADHGLNVLGDTEHAGSRFPTLCLHSESLTIEGHTHRSSAPVWFDRLELIKDEWLCRWLAGLDRRTRLVRSWGGEVDSLRWLHSESDPLRVDQFGSQYWMYWYGEQAPKPAEWERLERLAKEAGWSKWLVQARAERGRSGGAEELVRQGPVACQEEWVASENGLKFEFRIDNGLSPGLFLDQRRNRDWVKRHSDKKSVLNLFCYTGGFSVAAAVGGASKVVSVDLSKSLIERTRRNFALNELDQMPHEFRAIEAREYLRWAHKKGLEFDLVVCDPPSFGRSKSGVFSIDKDLAGLVEELLAVTKRGGRLLFSLNFEKWTEANLLARLQAAVGKKVRFERTPEPDFDYEVPGQTRNMKSVFLVRL